MEQQEKKENTRLAQGHLAAIFTILFWGTTFISTKVLLESFAPVEILLIRFVTGYLVLWILSPRFLHIKDRRQELYFAGAGLSGITLYYLLENIALTYTYASNISVIVCISPFFIVLFSCLFLHEKNPGIRFFAGLVLSLAGICLISFNGSETVAFNPIGDLLAVGAAIIWACYSVLIRKISTFEYPAIQTTRRTFFYGTLFMIPISAGMGFDISISQILETKNLLNLLFLGVGASAICFVTWNVAVKELGTVKTSVYVYAIPVITTVSAAVILGEKITVNIVAGIILTLAGLLISEKRK